MKPSIPLPTGPGAQRRTSHTRVRSLRLLALLIVLAMAVSFPLRAHAAGGNLDTAFGNGGKVTTDINNGSADTARGVVIQPDGKIVAVGDDNTDFAVVRYNVNGSLDSGFGSGGKVTTPFGSGSTSQANAVALQSDGKVVAAGFATTTNGNVVALARYNTDGTLDSGFGSGGKVTTPFGGNAQANGVAVQADGKIVVVGFDTNNLLVARYNTNGSPDTTFGSGGETSFFFSSSGALDNVYAVAIQSDGKIVVAGNTVGNEFALARFNTNGTLDTSFGMGGKVTTSFGGSDQAHAVAIQSDGKIVAAGTDGTNFALARYNTDGSLDTAFNGSGKVTTPFNGNAQANGVTLQSDGKIVAAGTTGAFGSGDFALARYNTNGSLDTGFGTSGNGKVTTDFNSGSDDIGNAVAIGSGKIVVAGSSTAQGNQDFAVARYDTGVVPDLTITKTHSGDFHQGQTGAQYTITVSNGGAGPTQGTVTVQDTLPSGLTATSLSGTGWSCNVGTLTCTRSDALATSSSYPALTLTVDVAANAPASVTNKATVSGGGETNTANDIASDPTTIQASPPDLTIAKTHSGNFTQGQTGAQYTITVSNNGSGPTAGQVTVTDNLPSGLTATGLSGTGWSCDLATLTCTRSDALVAGNSYPALTLTVDVAANAPANVTNQATVSGGGETNTANDSASDPTIIGASSGPSGPPTATPELSSGELVATSVVPLALLALYRRRRARRSKGRR